MRAKPLSIGEPAPDLVLTDQNGEPFRLREAFQSGRWVVLFFYPKDESMGCTRQVCRFRDQYEDFAAAGADLIGISADDAPSHQRFAERYHLPFRLLTDPDGQAQRAFGIRKAWGFLPRRVTFVMDSRGTVRLVIDDLLNPDVHIDRALALIREGPRYDR